ncbi:gasdermin-E [Protopterus annectens]|uniref:gasdermin-E n=1 Tax=Protopterus annectens TaxID=7888 RepID=UPI001CFAE537|nr:gasdermin-E [Protopterus annectens]XP_043923489.1 gasdermin-E [Protopterus annectens]
MFANSTKQFVKEIDTGGRLIPLSRLNDSDRLHLLGLVRKKKRLFFWQKPRYFPTSFTLNDVLTEGDPIRPVVEESDFTTFEGSYEDSFAADAEANVLDGKVGANGKRSIKVKSSFGLLKRREVNVPQLLTAVQNRKINVNHPLVQQTREHGNEVLCIVREKILTTQKCSISEHDEGTSCSGMLGFNKPSIKVSVTERESIRHGSDVGLEIPAETALAYCIIELDVFCDGGFELCLLPDKPGSFRKECMKKPLGQNTHEVEVDAATLCKTNSECCPGGQKDICGGTPLSALEAWPEIKEYLKPLADLPKDRRSKLNKICYEMLFNGEQITLLEDILDSISSEEKPDMAQLKDLEPSKEKSITDLLHLLDVGTDQPNSDEPISGNEELLKSSYFFISAMEEMPDAGLAVLGICHELQILPSLTHLMTISSEHGLYSLEDPAISAFKDEWKFKVAQRLFSLSKVNLEVFESTVKATTMEKPGFLPVILCVVLYGFAVLREDA